MNHRINVLIIDDDETDRYITRRQLAKNDLIGTIAEAADGSEAYAMFVDGRFAAELGPHPPPTLVLLDINMPIMSGFDLLERLETDEAITSADVSVVAMLTSSTHFGDQDRAGEYALVDDYIEKPLTPAKLESLIERHWTADPRQ